ncbi:MAG: S8/S53 family peptidase [Bacteroidota bacterium]
MQTLYSRFICAVTILLLPFYGFGIGDSARVETKLDLLYQQHGLTGAGTIVAIIDRGIDYQHPDFIDDNGNTRIAYIFDMLDNSGMNDPNNSYGVGTIYDMATINQALQSGSTLATIDPVGHGIATTGIAAGNGRAISSNKYRGVAHEATIIAVKAFTDALPAFDNFPGQAGVFNPSYLKIALDFVSDKVAELNMPSVTLMNLGSTGGPTDGTSDICQAMDAFVGSGKLLVCGVGDDGGGDNYASGSINQGDTAHIEIQKGAGNLRFDLWYSENDRFDIMITKPDGTVLGPWASPASSSQTNDQTPAGIFCYQRGADVEFFGASSHRREVLIDFTQGQGMFTVSLIGSTVTDGSFHATLNPGNYSTPHAFLSYVQAGGSINDYASAFDVITPTDYVVHTEWVDFSGTARQITGQGDKGDLWIGSSEGPTHDGRQGVDIAVPGEVLFTSYSAGTWYHHNAHNLLQDGNGFYGIQNAVSACAPLLTGVLALMLELDPTLTPDETKEFLHQTARSDAFTGTTPNARWGYGKLDALALIDELASTLSVEPAFVPSIELYPNPAKTSIHIDWSNWNQRPYDLHLFSVQGQAILAETWKTATATLNIASLVPGVYILQIRSQGVAIREKFVKLE